MRKTWNGFQVRLSKLKPSWSCHPQLLGQARKWSLEWVEVTKMSFFITFSIKVWLRSGHPQLLGQSSKIKPGRGHGHQNEFFHHFLNKGVNKKWPSPASWPKLENQAWKGPWSPKWVVHQSTATQTFIRKFAPMKYDASRSVLSYDERCTVLVVIHVRSYRWNRTLR